MSNDDAIDEEKIILCCGVGCFNCGWYHAIDCCGCSGKIGLCCVNMQVCCKPSAPCLPCGCCGPRWEYDGCSVVNAQLHCCHMVCSGALPCNKEVPVVLTALGLTVFPKCGCCITKGDLKTAEGYYVRSEAMER
ncbi:hypothetical protein IV203_003831 [Nitzschia inconspicua]|uniref:Uncharacterized protein n=1 Tax=Nitzschia inconspicua TaxID=303405 RepID=A0A9K3PL08_9STRA|nr:hypothetical protein IV203_010730 [Nitzschia inconspicua]KAG7354475.1 hypothetical protein IV203_003831 [Nitzschia inconspicua]